MSWVVLELTSRGEQDDPDTVTASIAKTLKVSSADVFLPVSVTQVGGDRVLQPLYDGYAFARLVKSVGDYFRLENSKYVQSVLLKTGSGSKASRVSTVSDAEVLRMRDQVREFADQGIGVGDTVRILSGPYRNMLAQVVVDIPETKTVQVYVKLRSKQSLLDLPRSFLLVETRAPYSRLESRVNELLLWATRVSPILKLRSEDTLDLEGTFKGYSEVHEWYSSAFTSGRLVEPDHLDIVRGNLYHRMLQLEHHERLQIREHQAGTWVLTCGSPEELDLKEYQLQQCVIDYSWLTDYLDRVSDLWLGIESLKRGVLSLEKSSVIQNIIIDGHNLAFRCMYAPGMSKLADRSGRPTGAILGFLRSLGALKKRFPEAALYVTWDGSSKRRKQKFGEYKANRPPASGVDSFKKIKDLLSLVGVYQVWNPNEEADDVIATLVRGTLADQQNLIFSTDRDLLQLVTENTRVLYPAVGSRNEVLFDTQVVVENIGVPPDKIVQLRSLYGDDSDNIPGVPRVPKKILKQLIQSYGSVAGIYQAGLGELTKGQYDRIRAAEPQIRINVELMTLLDVDLTTIPPNVDPNEFEWELRDLDIEPSSHMTTFFGSYDDE